MRATTSLHRWLVAAVQLWAFLQFTSYRCQALSTTVTTMTAHPTTTLSSIGKSQLAVLDGGEWISVQSILHEEIKKSQQPPSSPSLKRTKYGYLTVVTGKDDDNRRVVAMQSSDHNSSEVYQDTVAVIPPQISEEDAISTYIASLSCIHCALPKLENVGGGSDFVASGKAVVLGSSEVACFAAEGLASLGIDVTMVNNKGSAKVKQNVGTIQVIKPSVGSSETGFCSHLGQFDALVDTIGNEKSNSLSLNDPLDDDDEGDFYDIGMIFGSSVLQLLKTRHNCHKYVSTYTYSQELVANEGIFGGPGKTDQYSQKVGNLAFLSQSRECQPLLPPKSIGNTLEKLLSNGVVYTDKQRRKIATKKSDAIRGWTLADFWEATSWPRDSSGTGTVRYGLPVREDEVEEFTISEAPYRPDQARAIVQDEDADEIGDFGLKEAKKSSSVKNKAVQNNPYVLNVLGVEGMRSEIVENEMDCIMFMSAKFCKTCRTINPIYTRMARLNQENDNSNISFVKAETSGEMGKALGRYLSVQAVPAFVLFRNGEQYGVPLSVSKLPSKKIDRALDLLASGAPWDGSILDDEDDKSSS